VYSGILHVLTLSSISGVLSIRDRTCLLFASTYMFHPCLFGVSAANLLKVFCFVCVRIVACVLNDASVSGLPILA